MLGSFKFSYGKYVSDVVSTFKHVGALNKEKKDKEKEKKNIMIYFRLEIR
jgi:hypothetical protein